MKVALDGRALNVSIAKNKHKIPRLDELIDSIAEKLDGRRSHIRFASRCLAEFAAIFFTDYN